MSVGERPGASVHKLHMPERNPGTALERDWLDQVHVNLSAVERRAATLATRRTVKKDW